MKCPFPFSSWLVCVALTFSVARGETAPAMSAAVFDFQTTGESLSGKGTQVALLLNARLSSAAPALVLVERQELEKVLSEQELGLSGTISPDSAAKVGALTGAKALVTGRLFDVGGKFYLAAKVIGTETGRVYAESVPFDELGTLDKAVQELAGKVADDLGKHADTLMAKMETSSEHLERLRKLLSGGKLPSVSVIIPEQHLNRAIIDPAAQTEIKLVLQQLGFEMIDPQTASKQADVQIGGEAFSELAGRRGNLLSCRARLEVRLTRTASGELLLSDRQTDVAVDLAEEGAGKAALENAASKMLDRLVPKLASL